MRRLLRVSKLPDFCMGNGRVIPHLLNPSNPDFRSFHCADRRHDDSETIDFSPKMETAQATMVGILTMSGYVLEYSEGHYIFCTEEELDFYKEADKEAAEKERQEKLEREAREPENPARPRDVKITRDMMDLSYKAYEKCTIYPVKIQSFKFSPQLRATTGICQEDCIFCTCPFYAQRLLSELRYNHWNDYDEWVMEHFKNFKK